ncbi:nucleoporin protein Ndc1-Nup [Daldinia caldariorum]|uniref:nucleoporin protein Ndc1-Nup n=1 Tax=Daldinia caldariorum TaxID=326644 RepID=UPI0020082342|nr:nucleoporin protein Ndc1-Nup [Daldinia caldariorum]KAI1471148.1 nucleoporin protein Ndc1-Nup [Daldinia caldariorum]
MPPTIARRAPYKDFLQPALQRRFASTTGVLLGLAYVENFLLTTWDNLLWPWFPFGPAGIRTLAIFGCILPIIILRIAHAHIGIRTANSPFDTFRRYAFSFATIETIITFAISAWLFSQIYLISIPTSANLGWITYYSGDRARLNERALFYTVNIIILGVVQGVIHVSMDYDRMLLGMVKPKREGEENTQVASGWGRLAEWIPIIVVRAGMLSIAVALANYIVLYHFLRPSAWSWALSFFRLFYNLPKSNIPPSKAPWSIWMLSRSIWAGFLLCLMWYFGDMIFRLQLGRAPLKNGQPLSAESKDPNGSLLNGLQSKKPRISAFAMWELALITRDFDIRRRSIFEDIDRKDGPMWSQIYATCMGTIRSVEQRIDEYGKPPAPPPTQPTTAPPQPQTRVVPPPKTDDVWAPVPSSRGFRSSLGKFVTNVATSPGKTPAEVYLPEAKKKALEATEHLLTKEQKEALSPEGITSFAQTIALRFLSLPTVGVLFQQLFSRRLTSTVLGQPYGELSIYVNAAYALSKLAVSSLAEDKYGNVQRDVPAIIRTFTAVIRKLEKFKDTLPMHWTDLRKNRVCPEVDELLDALKDGLSELITAFGQYSSDLRLTRADMRLAREAAEKKNKTPEEEEGAAAQGPGRAATATCPAEAQPQMQQVR